jgi:hypothetical protein
VSNVRIAPLNFWDSMTLAGSHAAAAGYPYTNTQNTMRSSVWRSAAVTDQYVIASLPSGSVTCNAFFLFRHRCHGGTIQVRGYSDVGATGTVLFDTGAVSVYTPITTGYDWGMADNSALNTHDPAGLSSNFSAFFASASGVKSVKVDLTAKSPTYGYSFWEATRIFLGNYLELSINPPYEGWASGPAEAALRQRSLGGTLLASRWGAWQQAKFQLDWLDEAEIPAWLDIMQIAGTSRDIAVSLFPGAGGRQERDGIINGYMSGLDAIGRKVTGGYKAFAIEGA